MVYFESKYHQDKKFARLKADDTFGTMPYRADNGSAANRLLSRIHRRRVTNILIKVAAVLFIPMTLFSAWLLLREPKMPQVAQEPSATQIIERYQSEQFIEYIVHSGVKGKVLLPDSSEVWLNSNSTLRCPAEFASEVRYVELDGEGYFKVRTESDWPMYIKTSKGVTARILGTEFNLSSYSNDSEVKLTLVNGKVEVYNQHNKKIGVLPNERLIISDHAVPVRKSHLVSTEDDSAWKEGYLIFANTPMQEVVKKLERWYGVHITLSDKELFGYSFTARFQSESVTQVLDLLKISSNIRYRIKDKNVTLYK
jgi:ferric-dicitrate binding protein FerR (iron transport regulator)